jgi:hypothetical protein
MQLDSYSQGDEKIYLVKEQFTAYSRTEGREALLQPEKVAVKAGVETQTGKP